MPIALTVNGQPANLTALPAWSQSNAFLLYTVYREVLAVDARYPLAEVSVIKVLGEVPPHFHITIRTTSGNAAGWRMHLIFDKPDDPAFGVEELQHATLRWKQVEAMRSLRSAIIHILMVNPDLIDSLAFSF